MRLVGISGDLVATGSHSFEGVTRGGDLEPLRLHRKAQFLGDFRFNLFELFALELHDLVAVLTNDVAVIGMNRVVRIVKLVILAEVHFAHQAALGQERQGAIDCCAGNRLVPEAGPFQELFGSEMLVGAENRFDDGLTLRCHPQVLLQQKVEEPHLCELFVRVGHAGTIGLRVLKSTCPGCARQAPADEPESIWFEKIG